jgi:hypothetical protein
MFPVHEEALTVQVELNVSMDDLAKCTLRAGMVPEVVRELKGITAEGEFSGVSCESSSFTYGMFHSTCSEIEIVRLLADGSVTTASQTFRQDLLLGAGGTMGTLGPLGIGQTPRSSSALSVCMRLHVRLKFPFRGIAAA